MFSVMRYLLFVFLTFTFIKQLSAQSCCGELTTESFGQIIRYDSVYAEAQPNYNGITTDLTVRITESLENLCEQKPLILLIHGGGFSAGTPALMDSVATEFARRGYLTASINYRLGFQGPTLTCPMDTSELIRAWYRATQDAKSAVRWFKERHDLFGIDTNLIFAGGWSAGGYTLSGLAWMNDESEKPWQANQLNDTLINNQLYQRPDLGSVQGISNMNNYNTSIAGIFSFSSSFLFPEHQDENERTAILYFNNKSDQYEIPWEDCTLDAWNYLCPNGLPKSCGIEAMLNQFEDFNIEYRYTLYETNICSHNLHEPCFPYFQEEISKITEFLNDISQCEIVGEDQILKTHNNLTYLIHLEELESFLLNYENWSFVNTLGQTSKINSTSYNNFATGFYYCYLSNSKQPPMKVYIY